MPTTTQSNPVFRVKFQGGALNGMTKDYPRERQSYTIFGWKYEASGKRLGNHWLYVPVPRSRIRRRFLHWSIATSGADPRLNPPAPLAHSTKRGRNAKCHCGSGKKYKKCHGQ